MRSAYDIGCAISGSVRKHGNSVGGAGRDENGAVLRITASGCLIYESIHNIVGVLKLILGEKVWREWRLSLPEIPLKEQRCFSPKEMRQIVHSSTGQWKVLFAMLAGTGMRCGEAFGLRVEDLDLANGRVYIAHLGDRKGGRVLQTRNGTPFCKSNVRRKLNQILTKLSLAPAGLHAFRHGRVSVLQANGVPGDLVKEWVGHSNLQTTSLYTHFQDCFRRQIAREVALFAHPLSANELRLGPNGPEFVQDTVPAGES